MTEETWESCVRIAGHCAATNPAPRLLTHQDRLEAALDAIIGYIHEHGWPSVDLGPIFRAGGQGIDRATYEASKHLAWQRYWHEAPAANDSVAEAITDRIAVWQIAWELTEGQWAAVWAVAEAIKRGSAWHEGAPLIGTTRATLATQLSNARERARRLWVAPGDTPPGMYRPNRGRTTRLAQWQYYRRHKAAA